MSPGGHLVTTVAACAAVATRTGSLPLTAGVAAGGFLIDVDHAIDYVLFERQRDLRPGAFLRYYVSGRVKRLVLALHSYELFALLALAAGWWSSVPLWGYLLGGAMHLALDIRFNGQLTPKSIVAFYSFTYRLAHRFDGEALLGQMSLRVDDRFWGAFFKNATPEPTVPDRATTHGGVRSVAEPLTLSRARDSF